MDHAGGDAGHAVLGTELASIAVHASVAVELIESLVIEGRYRDLLYNAVLVLLGVRVPANGSWLILLPDVLHVFSRPLIKTASEGI